MVKYNITISATAEKTIHRIPKKDIKRVIETIQMLAIVPFPMGCRKLQGEENAYRVRQGNYRIIYSIFKSTLTILVLKIGDRKDVYR